MLARERRVLGRRDAFQDQREVVGVLEALDVVPVEAGLELEAAGAGAPRLHEAPGEVALAPAVDRGVHREAERGIAVGAGALHPVVHPGVVAADVELEDAKVGGRRGDGFEPGVADGAEHLRDAELRRGLRGCRAAALREGLDRADGREHHRDAHGPPEQRGGRVDLRHVPEHARAEGDRVERLAVPPERGLGLGPADEVVPGAGRQVVARRADDLVERLELERRVRGHSGPKVHSWYLRRQAHPM